MHALKKPKNLLEIKPMASEADTCARLMAGGEPWTTLKRGLAECREIFSDAAFEKFIAAVDGRLAGFLVICMQGAFTGYIKAICVAPEFRGKGVGRAIIQFAEQRIFSESPNVFLCVSSFNRNAKRFYIRLGYKVIGELKDYVVKGHSEILMRKSRGAMNKFKPKTKFSPAFSKVLRQN
jgi:ribosomal protein S18 acetylase RimI-like enzyme